ncbi:zinc finger BED domain-containing protein DAYSLEEPER-like [Lotus japonicus]|uniref:zinc finger BED domain-containing protein DAYSLEEPER-like n=1 Tax=Lotus japonicus TaxID=34305 RepID=UPI00258E430D|nr:zinc finger BED domain-containing protein DAYSLEEPER-like [Lotus japonicus]
MYLEEAVLPFEEPFDILGWWKQNGLKYPSLQMAARDFLAIPISTVASESTFSTSGRFLTPHRSRLRPDTLEAMICYQNWLWSNLKGSSPSMDMSKMMEYSTTILEDMDVDIALSGSG